MAAGNAGGDARDVGNRGEFRQWRDQAAQMASDAQDLRRQLQAAGTGARDLQSVDEVIRALRDMGTDKMSVDPRNMQALSATALDKLRKLELDLRKRTDTTSNELFLSGADEAPPQYRPLVDEYFKELSKRSGAGATAPGRGATR